MLCNVCLNNVSCDLKANNVIECVSYAEKPNASFVTGSDKPIYINNKDSREGLKALLNANAGQTLPKDFVKFDSDKPMFHLTDPFAMEDLAKCLTFGAKKYDADNWKKGDILTYISALERHLGDVKKGVLLDDAEFFMDQDSGLQHGAALLCNSMFIHYFIREKTKK